MKLFRASFPSPALLHTHAAGELLRKANLEEFLKTVGVWK